MLPDKYRVKISNVQYRKKLETEKVDIECPKCHQRSDFRTVNKYDLLLNPVQQLLGGRTVERVWLCSCGKENIISKSKLIELRLPDPTFFGVIEEPPQRRDGLLDRKTYHKKIEKWVWTMISELEKKAADFRDDNWQKANIILDDDTIDGHEEND